MPLNKDREYRALSQPLTIEAQNKRIDSNYYVEGFATTYDTPYLLYEYDGIKYYEIVDRNALAGADLSDVIMQYDHSGIVFARNKMAKGKQPSLLIENQSSGFFIAADLGLIEEARRMYSAIESGLIYKMSWAFRVSEDSYDSNTRTRTILKIQKVYDVSAVSIPANSGTDISARSYLDGVIETEKRETLERSKALLRLKILLESV